MLAFLTLAGGDAFNRIEVQLNNRAIGHIGDHGFATIGTFMLLPSDLREIAKKTEECINEAELRKNPILSQRFVTGLLVLLAILLMPINVSAQQIADFQTRPIGHVQYDFSKSVRGGFFGAGWIIGNGQYYGVNNVNLLAGIGYRQETALDNWWLESMIQRQWSEKGPALLWDNRFQYAIDELISLYVEVAPFLDRKNRGAVYDMVVFERSLWQELNLRLESENLHKSGRDSLGVGPGIGWKFGSLGPVKVNGALVYQFRRHERDALRFYLVFNHRTKR